MKLIKLFCISVAFGLASPALSKTTKHDWFCMTLKDAKKEKQFLHSVSVNPTNFEWMKREVTISEAWLEKTHKGSIFLVFRFKFDGKEEDLPIKRDNEQVYLHCIPTLTESNVINVGRNQSWNSPLYSYLVPIKRPRAHWVRFKTIPKEDLTLKVITHRVTDRWIDEPTEISLKFSLQEKKGSD